MHTLSIAILHDLYDKKDLKIMAFRSWFVAIAVELYDDDR
jgi:hypothetical protein